VTRAQSLKYLKPYNALATASGQAALTDSDEGYGGALDNAMRAIGVSEDELVTYDVPRAKIPAFLAALIMFVLQGICAGFGSAVDVSMNRNAQVDKKRNQLFKNAKSLYEMAQKEAAKFGIAPGSSLQLLRLKFKDKSTVRGEF
jgi:hypothetical protein